MKIGVIAALSAVLLAGCASSGGKWERANTSPDDVAAAEADCRGVARQDTEDQLRARGGIGASSATSRDSRDLTGNWTSMMDQFSAEKRERQVFERCMTQQGFQFVPFSQ